MNAIIWWLESPWQLRALVFTLSFFVCFVAPWLHSQSLLTSRIAARKPLEEKSEMVSAPKAEVPHQDAEAQAEVPAPQEQVPVQEKAAPASVEEKGAAQHEQAPSKAEAPVHAMQVPAEDPVREEQASVPAAITQASTPPQAAAEEAPTGPEPKAPARQEQAAVQAPAPSAASKAQPASGFKIISQSASVISVPAAGPIEKQEFAASTENGGSADVEVYVLSNKAGRNLRRSNRVVDQSNGRAELSAVLDSGAFGKATAPYDTVACVGLASRSMGLSAQEITRLIENRAVHLCGIIARKPYVSTNTKLYGLPLGPQMDSARPEKERAQKSLIIIGLRNTKGDLTDATVQKKMVSEIIRGGAIANFPLSTYSEVASGKELRYIEVKGGNNSRPIKSSVVKPSYGLEQEVQRLLPAHHKRCGASRASRTHLIRSKKVSRSHANAETSGRKSHPGCGLFDFPF